MSALTNILWIYLKSFVWDERNTKFNYGFLNIFKLQKLVNFPWNYRKIMSSAIQKPSFFQFCFFLNLTGWILNENWARFLNYSNCRSKSKLFWASNCFDMIQNCRVIAIINRHYSAFERWIRYCFFIKTNLTPIDCFLINKLVRHWTHLKHMYLNLY